jgi:hypothetical protein
MANRTMKNSAIIAAITPKAMNIARYCPTCGRIATIAVRAYTDLTGKDFGLRQGS